MTSTERDIVKAFGVGEDEGWAYLENQQTEECWDDAFEILWGYAERLKSHERALAFLRRTFDGVDNDFVRSDVLLLMARLAMYMDEDARVDVYQSVTALEKGANSFLRARIIQALGIFSHILENSMLVAGQLTSRKLEIDAYCAMAHLRALRRCSLVRSDPQILKSIERYIRVRDLRVREEALYQTASVKFASLTNSRNKADFFEALDEVEALIKECQITSPQRPDVACLGTLLHTCRAVAAYPVDPDTLQDRAGSVRRLWLVSHLEADTGDGPEYSVEMCTFLEAVERIISILRDVRDLPSALDASKQLVRIAEATIYLQGLASVQTTDGHPAELALMCW